MDSEDCTKAVLPEKLRESSDYEEDQDMPQNSEKCDFVHVSE